MDLSDRKGNPGKIGRSEIAGGLSRKGKNQGGTGTWFFARDQAFRIRTVFQKSVVHPEFDYPPGTDGVGNPPDDRASPETEDSGWAGPLQEKDRTVPRNQDDRARVDLRDPEAFSGGFDSRSPAHEEIGSSDPEESPVPVDGDEPAGRSDFSCESRKGPFFASFGRDVSRPDGFFWNAFSHLPKELPMVEIDDGLVDVGGIGSEGLVARNYDKDEKRENDSENSTNHWNFPFGLRVVFACCPTIRKAIVAVFFPGVAPGAISKDRRATPGREERPFHSGRSERICSIVAV